MVEGREGGVGASADAETGSQATPEARSDLRPAGFDPARIAARLTPAQRRALLAVDKPYGRVRWLSDRWDLRPITLNGVFIQRRTQDALIDLGLIWARFGSIGYLPAGKAVRAALTKGSDHG